MKEPNNKINVKEFSTNYVTGTYPCLVLTGVTEAAPIVLTGAMLKGDMPVIIDHEGKQKEVVRIDASAYNIEKLLRVIAGTVTYVLSQDEEHVLTCVADYLNLV